MTEQRSIPTLYELRQGIAHTRNPNEIHRRSLSFLDKLAFFITNHVGTMGFFFIIFSWTVCWLSWNIFAPVHLRFDPYPAFVLWLFISNLIQLHLLPLIMIGQNIQARHEEIRSEHDFQTDRKAEKEVETILLHLEQQQKLILEILHRIENLEKKK